jgi:4-azaleucine resistance transporter AzlC
MSTVNVSHSTPRSEFLAGLRAVIPMVLGAIPFGLIFGAIALQTGLSPAAAIGMSMFVFAGSSQFIGATLYGQGAAPVLIIFTTFIVNARHALYSASLAPYLGHLPQRWLVLLTFMLTDESFAVSIGRFESDAGKSPHRHWFMLGANLFMYVNWQFCTVIGVVAGALLEGANLGLDFAMSVTFIGIVVPLLRTRPLLLSAVVSGAVALALNGLPNKLGLLVAALLGVTAGYVAETMLQPLGEFDQRETKVRE